MRRRCLDMLRQDNSAEAERLLRSNGRYLFHPCDDGLSDAITPMACAARPILVRAIIERTRGDVTFSLRGEKLERSIARLSEHLPGSEKMPEKHRSRFHRQQD